MKFAAIDIGSNAIRLLIENVFETKQGPVFHKDSLVRVPVRLGEESFLDGKISDDKIKLLTKTMVAMKHIMEIHKVTAWKACATSAMREASNSSEVIRRVQDETGIRIHIISGDRESKTILQFPFEQMGIDPNQYHLYIDVGGGSTELAYFARGRVMESRSFNIGTLRLLNDQVSEDEWKAMVLWVKQHKPKNFELTAIGVGGNINHVIKNYGRSGKMFLSLSNLKRIMAYIDGLSMLERLRDLGLKPDRADVIVPALRIYISVMKSAGIDKIFIPKQGLSDGIISELYHEWKNAGVTVQ